MRRLRPRTWCMLTALCAVGMLTVAPQSGWLVRTQFRLAGAGRPAPYVLASDPSTDARYPQTAAAHPDDFNLQLASALQTAPTATPGHPVNGIVDGRVRALIPLTSRFGGRPELYAHILRYLCVGDLRLHRDEEKLLNPTGYSGGSGFGSSAEPVSAEALDLADAMATRGEAVDPQNGYFPMEHAFALFAAHRDAEALAEIHRAAQLPNWNDYAWHEAEAREALAEAVNGRTGAIPEMAIQASILLPHLSSLRSAARVAVALAMKEEVSGDRAGGLAIRRDIARVGATMRVQSPTIIGSLVGIALTGISASRPDGAPPIDSAINGDARTAAVDSRYVAYLTGLGQAREAAWYLAERRAGERAKASVHDALDSSPCGMRSLAVVAGGWGVCILLLANAFWTLVCGGIAGLLARTPRIRSAEPLHPGVRCGLLLAAEIPVCGLLFLPSAISLDPLPTTVMALLAATLPVSTLLRLRSHGSGKGLLRDSLAAGATIATIYATAALAVSAGGGFGGYVQAMSCLLGDGSLGPSFGGDTTALLFRDLLMAAPAVLVPFWMVVILAVRGRLRRGAPASVFIVRGMRDASLPAVATLLLIYTGAALMTVHLDDSLRNQLRQMCRNEGQYDARAAGLDWPGPIPAPAEGNLPIAAAR